jgi:ribonuclease T2
MRRMLFALSLLPACTGVFADEPLRGAFVASQACPALLSIKKRTNPGGVTLNVGQSYDVIAANHTPATHYRLRIAGAEPRERWVAVSCGTLSRAGNGAPPPAPRKDAAAGEGDFFILAISWQPAFCEGQPGKPECRAQSETGFDARNFTLHGLWPQPRGKEYCGVTAEDRQADENRRWDLLPEVRLTTAVRSELDTVMPGTRSHLERHEWIKHGTCYSDGSAEIYFRDSLKLMAEINGSVAQDYFEAMTAKTVRLSDIRAKFDEAFGAGAGERIRVTCKDDGGRRLIAEITIGLRGSIGPETALGDLMLASKPTDGGCSRGEIDRVGLQ